MAAGVIFALVWLLLAVGATSDARRRDVTCFGRTATIIGTSHDDRLMGTPGADVISGLGGKDRISGGGGDDVLCGAAGADTLIGGRGRDTLVGDEGTFGRDRLDGGSGDDRLFGELGDDVLDGGAGSDELHGGSGDDEDIAPGRDVLRGGSGSDRLSAGPGDDRVSGGAGADVIDGDADNDELHGDAGNDELHGSTGDDRVRGDSGDDQLFGEDGDDRLDGGRGNDRVFGGDGADSLRGGRGNDLLVGGPGEDALDGGPGVDEEIQGNVGALLPLIAAGDRAGVAAWAAERSIAEINAQVAGLDAASRDRLATVVIDTNATGEDRDKMLRVVRAALATRELGFYAEIWSYTSVELVGGGFFGTCNHLFLSPAAWAGLSDQDARAVLLHESFHSFNCVNGGPVGSLDEGSAIWITKAPFEAPLRPGESLAEATYGSKLFHKAFFNNPNLPLVAPLNPTQKLLDVYAYLAAHDPSRLPWNSTERLVTCFDRYFADLDRNVDFETVWLPAVAARTELMLADAECKPL